MRQISLSPPFLWALGVVGVTVLGGTSPASSADLGSQSSALQQGSTITPLVQQPDLLAPVANINTALITGLYHEILGHAPDQGGLGYWINQLNVGLALSQVVDALWVSSEHFSDEVKSYYVNFLGRHGAANEIGFWVSMLQAGMDEKAVVAAFLSSAEFSQFYVNNKDFVSALYPATLGRPVDATGSAYWIGRLNAGVDRLTLTNVFLQSPELDARAIDSYYLEFLGRVADAGGKEWWLNQVLNNSTKLTQVAEAILSSHEFIDRAQAAVH